MSECEHCDRGSVPDLGGMHRILESIVPPKAREVRCGKVSPIQDFDNQDMQLAFIKAEIKKEIYGELVHAFAGAAGINHDIDRTLWGLAQHFRNAYSDTDGG